MRTIRCPGLSLRLGIFCRIFQLVIIISSVCNLDLFVLRIFFIVSCCYQHLIQAICLGLRELVAISIREMSLHV